MDNFEFPDASGPTRRKVVPARVWNILTILVLLAILCVVSVFIVIFIDPNSGINPFPPPTLFPSIPPATATVTPRFTLVPTWTATPAVLQATDTPMFTHTPLVTNTPETSPTVIGAIETSTPGAYAFTVQAGSPSAISGTTFHPDAGCDWSGVAGQATSLNDEAVRGLFVQLGGSMPGNDYVDKQVMTGLADEYGPGGFEITLADKLVASEGSLWIQLLDQQNLPLSEQIYFNTYDDCERNLIIIYFDQIN